MFLSVTSTYTLNLIFVRSHNTSHASIPFANTVASIFIKISTLKLLRYETEKYENANIGF